MKKRLISEYFAVVLLLSAFVFVYFDLPLIAFFMGISVIFLYGFVGFAMSSWKKGRLKSALFFLNITFYPTLMPFRKAFYFWMKSSIMLNKKKSKNPEKDLNKALRYGEKVKAGNLYTDGNKSLFYIHMMILYIAFNNKDKASECLKLAKETPHNEMLDDTIKKTEAYLNGETNENEESNSLDTEENTKNNNCNS